jgi:hypothetical protein
VEVHGAPLLELLLPHDCLESELAPEPSDEQPQPALRTLRLNGGIRNREGDENAPCRREAVQEASETLAGTIGELRHLAPLAARGWWSRSRQVTVGYDQSPLCYIAILAIM